MNVPNAAKTVDYRESERLFSGGDGRFSRVSRIPTLCVNYRDIIREAGEAVENVAQEDWQRLR
jgi:hypothetical protein